MGGQGSRKWKGLQGRGGEEGERKRGERGKGRGHTSTSFFALQAVQSILSSKETDVEVE